MLLLAASAAAFVPSTSYRPSTAARLRRPVMVEREDELVDKMVLIQNQLERMQLQRTIAELQSELSAASSKLQDRDGVISELQVKADQLQALGGPVPKGMPVEIMSQPEAAAAGEAASQAGAALATQALPVLAVVVGLVGLAAIAGKYLGQDRSNMPPAPFSNDAPAWERPDGSASQPARFGRSAPDIFWSAVDNLRQDTKGWRFGSPSPLYSNANVVPRPANQELQWPQQPPQSQQPQQSQPWEAPPPQQQQQQQQQQQPWDQPPPQPWEQPQMQQQPWEQPPPPQMMGGGMPQGGM